MWGSHRLCFLLALAGIVLVIVAMIVGVVTFMVTPSLPQARVSQGLVGNLRLSELTDEQKIAGVLLRVFEQ